MRTGKVRSIVVRLFRPSGGFTLLPRVARGFTPLPRVARGFTPLPRVARGFTPLPRVARGFTMVGVVIAIAILTILIAAVGPSIATIMKRDKETELIFRGKQYARAIAAFQKRYGRYPNQLKELVEIKPRSIRQLFREPMCNCDDWQVIIAGTPEAMPMGNGPAPPGGGLPGNPFGPKRTPSPGSGGNQPPSTYTGLQQTPPPFLGGGGASQPTPEPAPFTTGIFANHNNPQTTGPIVGVRSKLHDRALKKWRDKEWYDEWRFIVGDADNDDKSWFDPNSLRGPNFTPSPGAH